jgi:HIRAN domain
MIATVAALAVLAIATVVGFVMARTLAPSAPRRPQGPRGDPAVGRARVPLGPGEDFDFDIVGEASYLGTLKKASGGRLAAGETVVLPMLVVPEPENAYDPNAIAVYAVGFGKVGYFSRADAEEWSAVSRNLIATNAVGTCEGFLTGGYGEKKNIGVRLSLREPAELED